MSEGITARPVGRTVRLLIGSKFVPTINPWAGAVHPMADDTNFERRSLWRTIGSSAAVLALACGSLLLLIDPSTADEPGQHELVSVTFVVGGMMKSRSGTT